MNIPEYKYDFELSSKRKIFLWLHQVLPNIDVLKLIYQMKGDLEDEDNRLYHGLCPRNVKTIGSWVPTTINDNYKISKLNETMLLNALIIKMIVDKGFICNFNYNASDYTSVELSEIDHGNWYSVVPNIDDDPRLRIKIKLMNILYDTVPLLAGDMYNRLGNIYRGYLNNDYNGFVRMAIDQNDMIYIPQIYV